MIRTGFHTALILASWPLFAAGLTPHEIYQKVAPAVVSIEVDDGSASGFIISADGKILTNFHVIAHTKNATVRLENGDAYDDVQVLDIDKRKDIAILKIKAVDLPFLKLGRSATEEVGATVYTVSNPQGYTSYTNTLSQGLISGIRDRDGFHVFQVTAPTSHGSSGGPLFNARGQVIGITSSVDDKAQNVNFAIPVDYVRGMLVSLSKGMSLASVYESSSPSCRVAVQEKLKFSLLDSGKAVGRLAILLLTCWYAARLGRRTWRGNNEVMKNKNNTLMMRLWVRIGWPILLCTGVAILVVFEIAVPSS